MTEQQYRVIADRDKGDDPQDSDWADGDRVTFIAGGPLVRIERPVPTIDEVRPSTPWHKQFAAWLSGCDIDPSPSEAFRAGWLASEPHLPTREQITPEQQRDIDELRKWAEMAANLPIGQRVLRVLTLLQKGADR